MIKLGNTQLSAIKFGSASIQKVYSGSVLAWAGISYTPALDTDFSNNGIIDITGGTGGGNVQKLDDTFESIATNALKRTNRGLVVEPARTNYVAASSDLSNAAWTQANGFGSINAMTSVLPGQTAREFVSTTAAGLLHQNLRGTFAATRETMSVIVESTGTSVQTYFYLADSSASSVEVVGMRFNFSTQVITQRGNGTSPKYYAVNLGTGPNGGTLWLLVCSAIPMTAGNNRRFFIYVNDSGTLTAGRSVIYHHVQHEVGDWATTPIINSSTTSNSRGADVVKVSVNTGTYDVRFTLQDGTIHNRIGLTSASNLLTIPTDITEKAALTVAQTAIPFTEQTEIRAGYISQMEVWTPLQAMYVLGDSFVSTSYMLRDYLPLKFTAPRNITYDGVGGSSLADQATRFDSASTHWGKVLIIMDGGLSDTQANALAAIADIVANLTGTPKWLYIQSFPSTTYGAIGNAAYTTWATTTAAIAAQYPDNYVATLAPMQAFGDGTANDNSDIANGWIPRSLRTDDIHPNKLGSEYLAQIIAAAIEAKGW
jgi:hypothetical protein